MATSAGSQQRRMPLREKTARPATFASLAESEDQDEIDGSEDLHYPRPPTASKHQGSASKSRKRRRTRAQTREGRKRRRLANTLDGNDADAGVEHNGSCLSEQGVMAKSDGSNHKQQPRSATTHQESSDPLVATPTAPVMRSSPQNRRLSGPTTTNGDEGTPVPIQVILFNSYPDAPFIVLGTYIIAADTTIELVEKSKKEVGFQGNYSDPNDHVDGQILVRAYNRAYAEWLWDIAEDDQLYDVKRKHLLENHQPSSSRGGYGLYAKVRCLLHPESDVALVRKALREGKMEEV